jgi:hypothetical protein
VYFRRGGTVAGLTKTISENKDKIKSVVAALPLTDAQKAKLDGAIDNPSSVLPPQATQLISKASATIASVKSSLPPQALEVVNSVQKSVEQKVAAKLGIQPDEDLEAPSSPAPSSSLAPSSSPAPSSSLAPSAIHEPHHSSPPSAVSTLLSVSITAEQLRILQEHDAAAAKKTEPPPPTI